MAIDYEIHRADKKVFRRAFIRRRLTTTGFYETNWTDITKFIKKWGTIDRAIDDKRLNKFTHSGFNMTVRNDTGAFNPEDNRNSLWSGFMTRYRTLVKIEGGYITDAETELPTDTTLGIFIMTDEIPISAVTNDAQVRSRSIVSIFDEVRAADVAGLGPTQTASGLITKIRDHTDGSGNFYFQQFISSGAWSIQATTNNYNLATSTVIGSMSCWDFMEKLAEAEGYLIFINRTGGLEFRDRTARTTTSQFDFRGLGFNEMNVIALEEYREPFNKVFTFFRLKYLEPDTSTSYVTAGSTSSVDPSSTAWKYGSRIYNFETTFFNNTATAQTIVNNLNTEFSTIKDELTLKTHFAPQIEISDRVTVSYMTQDLANTLLWNQFTYDDALWPTDFGENFEWQNVAFKILSIGTDLSTFSTRFKLREI